MSKRTWLIKKVKVKKWLNLFTDKTFLICFKQVRRVGNEKCKNPFS